MSLPCFMQVLCTTWYIQVNLFRILMLFVSRISRQEEYCLSLYCILTSKYQSIVDDRMKIKGTSNKVNVLEDVVLQYSIIKIDSWMSLKSSEMNNYSWNVSAVLKSPFCPSSFCQASFPSIVRPIRNLCKLTLKMFLNSPEMNRSIIFSLYLLRMLKKMDDFLWNFVHRERMIPWFNINPIPFIHRNDTWWKTSRSPSLRFCLCLWSACKILDIQL